MHRSRSTSTPSSRSRRRFVQGLAGGALAVVGARRIGWTAGAGIEGQLVGNWTGKLEYLYIDLGKTEQTLGTPVFGQVISETRRFTDNIVRVGFNYRWGAGAY